MRFFFFFVRPPLCGRSKSSGKDTLTIRQQQWMATRSSQQSEFDENFFIAWSSSFAVLVVVAPPSYCENRDSYVRWYRNWRRTTSSKYFDELIHSFICSFMECSLGGGGEIPRIDDCGCKVQIEWTCYCVNIQQQRATIMSPLPSAQSRWQSGIVFLVIFWCSLKWTVGSFLTKKSFIDAPANPVFPSISNLQSSV